jgi:hypothetical protein
VRTIERTKTRQCTLDSVGQLRPKVLLPFDWVCADYWPRDRITSESIPRTSVGYFQPDREQNADNPGAVREKAVRAVSVVRYGYQAAANRQFGTCRAAGCHHTGW